jgi:hypothetical protein
MKRFRSLATFLVALAISTLGLLAPTALPASAACDPGFVQAPNGSCIAPIVEAPPPPASTPTTAYVPPAGTGTGTYVPPAGTGTGTYVPPAGTGTGTYVPPAGTGTGTYVPPAGTGTGTGGVVCMPGMGPPACPASSGTTATTAPNAGSAGGLNCTGTFVPNATGTACIAPVVGTTDGKGNIDCTVPANQATALCGGGAGAGTGTFFCNGAQVPNGTFCPPSTGAVNTNTQQNQNAQYCAPGTFYDEGIKGCKSSTGSASVGGTNASGCMNGMIRDANGSCIAPIVSNTGQIDCSAAANRVTTACGGNIAVQAPATATANANNNWINCGVGFFYDEGIKGCKSTGASGGVVNQVATIKCKDGSVRVTAIECDNVGGGSAGVAVTCPSNQVPSPSGTYCIYPTTGGTNANAGTYRAECAANPPPASCLGQAVNTFEGNATMAKAANFTAFDPNAVQIKYGIALDQSGQAIGQLARSASGQSFSVAAPPPPPATPSTGGKKASPAPKKKASTAPVILLNVTDANGDEVKDSSGKALTTAPVVKQGNFVFSDRNGKPVMATPTLDQNGKPVEHQGKVLYTKLVTIAGQEALTDADGNAIMAVPLLDENGKPLVAKNGEVLYAPPLTNALGETIINQKTNQPVLASPMADADGNAALGANKKPFMGQPILNADNQVLTVAGQPVYTGAAGMPVTTSKLQQIRSAQGQDLQFAFGGTLVDEGGNTVLGPDGRPTILSVSATPLMINGLPLVDKNGKACRINNKGQVTDSSGRLILGTDGKPMALGKWETFEAVKVGAAKTTVKDPTGKTAVLGLNAQLFDSKGNPIVTATGAPIYFDGRTKSLVDNKNKVIRVDSSGRVPGKIATLAFQTVTFAA